MHYLEFEFCNQSEHVRVQFLLKFEFYLHNRKNCVRKIYQNQTYTYHDKCAKSSFEHQ